MNPRILVSFCRAEEPETASLFFCVLDGHGECGELVSGYFQRELAKAFFVHPSFEDNPKTAFVEVLRTLESTLLRGECCR